MDTEVLKLCESQRGTGTTTRTMVSLLQHQVCNGQCMVYVPAQPEKETMASAIGKASKYSRLLDALGIENTVKENVVSYAGKWDGKFTGRTVTTRFLNSRSKDLLQKQQLEVGYIYEVDFL